MNNFFQPIIDKIEAEGLIQIKFTRKPRTGVHAFFDPVTNERFYTHTTGYVRRAVPGTYNMRYAPINKNELREVRGTYSTGQPYSHMMHKPIFIMSEIDRLEYLLQYAQRRNKRIVKKAVATVEAQPEAYDLPVGADCQHVIIGQAGRGKSTFVDKDAITVYNMTIKKEMTYEDWVENKATELMKEIAEITKIDVKTKALPSYEQYVIQQKIVASALIDALTVKRFNDL